MPRIPSILTLCLVFGSMWLHGGFGVSMDEMDHGMMGPTCLEHCLDAVHVDSADEGTAVVFVDGVSSQTVDVRLVQVPMPTPIIESHHDPTRILTTIKRE